MPQRRARHLHLALTAAVAAGPVSAQAQTPEMPIERERELIVLAAPLTGDPYYARVRNEILDFHVGFAQQIAGRDDALVLVDEGMYHRYAEAIGQDRVALVPLGDIWARDFGLANSARPVLFRYTAAGQGGGRSGQADADAVQGELADLLEEAGLDYVLTDLLNDGGNYVDDGAGHAIVSRKFLRDNGLNEAAGRRALHLVAGVDHVAFIEADEQGGLEHADGVVAFVDVNTVIVNAYPDDPDYAQALHADLRRGLPGVRIHEIVAPYDGSQIVDARFGSACGLYTNALVTSDRVYLPQFGIPEDRIAMEQVQAITSKEVVPVQSGQVCAMGGGVRCLSWQLRGENALALLAHLGLDRSRGARSR